MKPEQRRLVTMVDALAKAIDRGDVMPSTDELQALVMVLDRANLPDEAARVWRWLP